MSPRPDEMEFLDSIIGAINEGYPGCRQIRDALSDAIGLREVGMWDEQWWKDANTLFVGDWHIGNNTIDFWSGLVDTAFGQTAIHEGAHRWAQGGSDDWAESFATNGACLSW